MTGRSENKIKTENSIKVLLQSLPDVVEDYYNNLSVSKEPKTCREYLYKIRGFLSFINEDTLSINVKKITESDVAKYMKHIELKTDRDGTISETSFSYRKSIHTILSSFFNYLFKRKMITSNPISLIERPHNSDVVKYKILEIDDVKQIINAINNDCVQHSSNNIFWRNRNIAIVQLLINTGMRETALSEINMEDINLQDDELTIIDKNHKTHIYNINKTLKQALTTWISNRYYVVGDRDVDALFISNRKTRMSPNAISHMIRKYSLEALGYEVSPHKLRAAYCTILYEKTKDIELVRRAVGHADVSTTQRYIRRDDKKIREIASSVLDDVLTD